MMGLNAYKREIRERTKVYTEHINVTYASSSTMAVHTKSRLKSYSDD